MNFKAITFALLGLAVAAAPAFASKQDSKENGNKDKKECKGHHGKCHKGECPNPFEGLNLTADQQTKLDALRQEYKAKKSEAKKDLKEKRQEMSMEAKAKKSEYLDKLKQILTPEQYVTYLENQVTKADHHKMGKKPHGDHKKGDIQKKDRK